MWHKPDLVWNPGRGQGDTLSTWTCMLTPGMNPGGLLS